MVKNLLKILNVNFDCSKEASWGTERKAKNHRSLQSTVTEKIKNKTPKNANFPQKCPFGGHFGGFS